MSDKVLIAGGAGFIGSNLAIKLNERGYNVTVLDNLSPQIHGNRPAKTSPLFISIKDDVKFINGTVLSRDDWRKAIENQDAIINLAAETGTGQSMYDIQRYVDVNIGGTGIMLDILANEKHSIKKIVIASSRAVYGEGKYECKFHGVVVPSKRREEDMANYDFECKCPVCDRTVFPLPTSEDTPKNPSSIYAITKQTQEQMVLISAESLGLPALAFRYQNVYGPGQSLRNPYTGIISIFSTQMINGNNINIFEDGKESRDFVYIDDAVYATILGLEKEESNYHVFNVGTSIPIDVITVAKTLKQYYNSNANINISGNYRLGDIRHNYADLTNIKKVLGFNPKWTFTKGIESFCEWVKRQDIQSDKYEESINKLKEKGLFRQYD